MAVPRLTEPAGPAGPEHDDTSDRGSVMIITLVLCTVLATLVVSITTYASVGLRSSLVTDARLERRAAAEAGVWWTFERLVGGEPCDEVRGPVGSALELNAQEVHITCSTADGRDFRVGARAQVGETEEDQRVLCLLDVTARVGSSGYTVRDQRVRGDC